MYMDVVLGLHEMIDKLPLTRDKLISNHESDFVIQDHGTQIWYL